MNEQSSSQAESADLTKEAVQSIQPFVFFTSAGLIGCAVLLAILFRDDVADRMAAAQKAISNTFGWFYIASLNFFLGLCVFLACGRYRNVRIGTPDCRPDFSRWKWFAMLFSAGLGIGLFFYGVAEPVLHFSNSPFGVEEPVQAARDAMAVTIFHWGLHGWALYAVVALSIALPGFRRGRFGTIRSAFRPLIGGHADGTVGDIIDVLAVVATLTGVATSLGIGAQQIHTGLRFVGVVSKAGSDGLTREIVIIAVVTLMATTSVVLGLRRGICRLSEINVVLSSSLVACVFLLGPTWFILEAILQNTGDYVTRLLALSFWTEAYEDAASPRSWQSDWTVFYWAWWVSWAPFVGMFIARISRGRTIREFMFGVLLLPTAASLVWFTVFGSTALKSCLAGDTTISLAVGEDVTTALFVFLKQFPASTAFSLVALVAVSIFFVTSSDSGSMVIDIIASGGCNNPPVWQRVFWSVLEGVVAVTLLVAGGLDVMQSANMIVALPFCLVIIAMAVALLRELNNEPDPANYIHDGGSE